MHDTVDHNGNPLSAFSRMLNLDAVFLRRTGLPQRDGFGRGRES